jgi:hypothetical protein
MGWGMPDELHPQLRLEQYKGIGPVKKNGNRVKVTNILLEKIKTSIKN